MTAAALAGLLAGIIGTLAYLEARCAWDNRGATERAMRRAQYLHDRRLFARGRPTEPDPPAAPPTRADPPGKSYPTVVALMSEVHETGSRLPSVVEAMPPLRTNADLEDPEWWASIRGLFNTPQDWEARRPAPAGERHARLRALPPPRLAIAGGERP